MRPYSQKTGPKIACKARFRPHYTIYPSLWQPLTVVRPKWCDTGDRMRFFDEAAGVIIIIEIGTRAAVENALLHVPCRIIGESGRPGP